MAGHKPCLQTFGADQFNDDNLQEKKARSSFFNWWYFGICIGSSIGMLIVFYVQESVGWVVGFAAVAMGIRLVVFLFGGRLYRRHTPHGSPLTRIIQVFVAAIRKQYLRFSKDEYVEWNDEEEGDIQTLPRTSQLRCLDKATIIDDTDGKSVTKNAWRLCTILKKFRSGITILQRIGFGMFLATMSMVIAALVERTRIRITIENGLLDQPNKVIPMSVWWPLLCNLRSFRCFCGRKVTRAVP